MSQHRTPFTTSHFAAPSARPDLGADFAFRSSAAGTLVLDRPRPNEDLAPRADLPDFDGIWLDHTEEPLTIEEPERTTEVPVVEDRLPENPVAESRREEPLEAPRKRGGKHRLPAPPAALKGRAAVVAVAAGAAVAAAQAAFTATPSNGEIDHAAAGIGGVASKLAGIVGQPREDAAAAPASAPQVLNVATAPNPHQFDTMLTTGQKFDRDRAAAEAAKLRPLYALFAHGEFTSGFGARWGAFHAGVDVAAPIGTPIYAVEDGDVISAGPASGFGMWVRLRHADGTITVYGHIHSATVQVGQHVLAGDQIATIGNRGDSTGPHCHFEVWLNGKDKVNPLPWLASRGISLGPQVD